MKYAQFGNYEPLVIKQTRDDEHPDVVFSFGGDGTMLSAIHRYIEQLEHVKFIGVNTGKLGFFTDFDKDELPLICEMLENNQFEVNEFHILEYTLYNDKTTYTGYALNELAIISPVHTQNIDVYINDEHFETFRGTGLLVSPPTGSTAYNKSLGGSVIDPHICAIQLTEIAPISNRVFKSLSSPLILSEKSKIALLLSENQNPVISADGIMLDFNDLHKVTTKLSQRTVSFIVKPNTDFFHRVKRSFIK
ncbi:MAG: NAD kinase [Bacilli bacterium]